MFLLYCDETNLDPNENEFFIYGGIALPNGTAKPLHNTIERVRRTYGIPKEFFLKFNPKPDHLTHQQFIEVKQSVIEAAVAQGCILLVSIILHRIADSPEAARRNEINRVVYHFNCLLNRSHDHGLVLVDRFSDSQIDAHLREKFSVGLRGLPYCITMRLENIVGYHYSAIGQSHFPSIVDILIGSIRFAVNAHTKRDASRLQTAARLLQMIAPLFFRRDPSAKVSEISLFFSPKTIKVSQYREQYISLRNFFSQNGIEAEQEITEERTF